jgi:predicted permease
VLGRLRPGLSRAAAGDEATVAYRRGMEGEPYSDAESRVLIAALTPGVGPSGLYPQARIALWLSGVSLIVFLIAVANVTNLLLQRAAQRQQEIAVRLALGMGRSRLARQWMTESLLLAVLGGGLGLIVSRWGGELIRLTLLPGMAPSEGWADWRVLAVTGATVLAAGVLTGLLPAIQAISPSLLGVLKNGRQARTFRRSPLRTGLLLAQTVLSTVLLIGSGLFVSSFQKVRSQDFGFSTQRTLLATFQFDTNVPGVRRDALYRDALARLKTLPGVEEAIPTDSLPFASTSAPAIDVPGVDLSRFQQMPFMNAAALEYFKVLGIRLLRGRGFTAADNPGGAPVVVISETMARTFWPDGDAIGKCLRFGFVPDPAELATAPCREVVGIVNDVRPRSIRPEPQPVMQFYVPYDQVPPPYLPEAPRISGLLIRTAGDPERMAAPVQRALQSFAPDLPYANVRPYQSLIDPQMGTWRLGAVLFSVFGGLALAMAAIGLYGVLSYMVAQRSKEMGIRMALGARSGDVIRLVVGEGLWFAGLGILAGGAAALAAGSWLQPLLFDTRPWEPAVLAEVALTLGAVTLLASLLPAWRATRTDPNLVLKME